MLCHVIEHFYWTLSGGIGYSDYYLSFAVMEAQLPIEPAAYALHSSANKQDLTWQNQLHFSNAMQASRGARSGPLPEQGF